MEDLNVLLLISRWLHVSAAIVAVGGAAYARFMLLPAAIRVLDSDQRRRLVEAVRARWAPVTYSCIALLLLSGTFNFVTLAILPKVEPFPYHAIFGVKLVVALAVFLVSSVLVGRSPGLAAARRRKETWLSVVLILAGLIVLLSGALGQVRTRSGADRTGPTARRASQATPALPQ
jgi:uncharacterized membrane protein